MMFKCNCSFFVGCGVVDVYLSFFGILVMMCKG